MKPKTNTERARSFVEEMFPHPPEVVWKALATPSLLSRWFKMTAVGFEPVIGNQVTYQTDPAEGWDGTVLCQVIEVILNERFTYSWKGGNERNTGYGSLPNTVVTFTQTRVHVGTRLRMVHSGFERPRNDTAYGNMSGGWPEVIRRLRTLTREQCDDLEEFHTRRMRARPSDQDPPPLKHPWRALSAPRRQAHFICQECGP